MRPTQESKNQTITETKILTEPDQSLGMKSTPAITNPALNEPPDANGDFQTVVDSPMTVVLGGFPITCSECRIGLREFGFGPRKTLFHVSNQCKYAGKYFQFPVVELNEV